ncbi:unnamed protein product [Closterium sp. Naga37s-1]|nr:unnamed protein product [Closterium sp. Naga37s-1]
MQGAGGLGTRLSGGVKKRKAVGGRLIPKARKDGASEHVDDNDDVDDVAGNTGIDNASAAAADPSSGAGDAAPLGVQVHADDFSDEEHDEEEERTKLQTEKQVLTVTLISCAAGDGRQDTLNNITERDGASLPSQSPAGSPMEGVAAASDQAANGRLAELERTTQQQSLLISSLLLQLNNGSCSLERGAMGPASGKAAALVAVMTYCVARAGASTRKQSDWRARISMNGRRNFADAFGLPCEANPRLKFDYSELVCDEERTPTQVYNLESEGGIPLVKPLEKGGLLRWHFAEDTMRPFGTALFDIIVRNAFQKGAGGSATVVKAYHIAYLLYLVEYSVVHHKARGKRIPTDADVNAADIASYHRKVKAAIRKTLEESPDDQLPAWSEQYQGWVFGPTETVVISGSGFPDLVPDGADPDAAEKKAVALLFEYAQVEPEKGKKKKTGSNNSDATMERDLLDDVGEWEDAEDSV